MLNPYVPRERITFGITVTFMLHSLKKKNSMQGTYLYFRFLSILLCGHLGERSPQFGKFSFFFFLLLTVSCSGHLSEIRWSVCISIFQRSLCVSFSRRRSGLCMYHLFIWSMFKLLSLLLLLRWNYIIASKLLVLHRKFWNNITLCRQMIFIWYVQLL